MKKKFVAFLLTLIMILPFVNTAYAADKGDTTNSSSGSGKINGKTYYYDQFDNSAYRTVYNQINEAAAAFNSSNQTAQYQDGGYYTAFPFCIPACNIYLYGCAERLPGAKGKGAVRHRSI